MEPDAVNGAEEKSRMEGNKKGIRGKLKLGKNCCTEEMRIHPLKNATVWYLQSEEFPDKDHISLIGFDGRQVWDVYYYRFADTSGWEITKGRMTFRMREEEFERFFGKWEIEE